MAETQISAYISEATKRQVERYAEAHGVKKGHLVEEALLHHLQAHGSRFRSGNADLDQLCGRPHERDRTSLSRIALV